MSEIIKPPEIFLATPPGSVEPMPPHKEFVSRANAEMATTRDEIIERVFDRDQQTSQEYEDYLWDRLKDLDKATENWTTTTTTTTETIPIIETVPTVERRLFNKGWSFKPFAITGLAFTAAMVGVNADNMAIYAKDKLTDNSREKAVEVPVEIKTIETSINEIHDTVAQNAETVFPDSETIAKESVDRYVDEMQAYEYSGGKLLEVTIIGQASDETARAGSLGTPDELNKDIATNRGLETFTMTQEAMNAQGMDTSVVKVEEAQEAILSTEQLNVVGVIMEQYGYKSLDSVKDAYRTGQLPPAAMATMDTLLGAKRGSIITSTFEFTNHETKTVITVVPDKDRPLEGDFLWPIIIPPYPRLGIQKTAGSKQVQTGEQTIISSETDEYLNKKIAEIEDIKLLPEGVIEQEDGTLVLAPEAWAYTRKYQALLREGRISGTLAFRHNDPERGNQEIRVLFVDHHPSQEEIDNALESLSMLAQARGAEIFDLVKVVSIMPGKGGDNEPKEMGLSIDKKADPDTLGLAIPMLGIIEVNTNTLEAMSAQEFRYTIEHEGFHLLDSNPTGDVASIWRNTFAPLPEWRRNGGQRRRAMEQGVWLWEGTDANGNRVRQLSKTEPDGLEDLQRLGPPTNYGRSNWFEDVAETGAVALNRDEELSSDTSRIKAEDIDPLRAEALISFLAEKQHKMRDLENQVLEHIEETGEPGWSVPVDFPSRLSHTFYSSPIFDPVIAPLMRESAKVRYHRDTLLTSLGQTVKR